MTHFRIEAALACLLLPALAALAADRGPVSSEDYLPEDIAVSGREMHSFSVDGKSVSVVLGQFGLTVGRRQCRGRDAVLWIRESRMGDQVLRDILVYIEGDVQITEPSGTVTRDRVMLVPLRHRGRLRADVGRRYERSQENLPLYQRALAARRQAEQAATRPATRPTTGPATRPIGPTVDGVPTTTRPVKPPAPVTYRWKTQMSSKEMALRDGSRQRVTVLTGSVYLHQAAATQAESLEMLADAAVLFSAPSRTPAGERPADPTDRPGKERVLGAYLEGDVRISRGERSIRSRQVYYDFVNQRAILLDAVLHSAQEQRNIPIYVRAAEIRQLSRREMWFRDAKISSSEFHTPTYHIGASRAYLMDTTPYDQTGTALGERSYNVRMKHTTVNVRGLPVLYLPWLSADGETGDSPLSRVQVGDHGRLGFGAETEWHLFRMLGLVSPRGVKGKLNFDIYDKGTGAGIDARYARETFAGFVDFYGVRDKDHEDDFGRDRKNVPAPSDRGRFLWRHKQYFPDNWELQAELSYLCDRNFLEAYFRDEFWTGKDQDTLLYAKKQQDDWAFTALLQGRVNDFITTTESAPEVGYYLIGRSLWRDQITVFGEAHAGVLRFSPDHDSALPDSDFGVRADTRGEVNVPKHLGPVNLVPYGFVRGTYWSEGITDSDIGRGMVGGGVKANVHLWKVFDHVHSRLLDIHRLRYVATPEAVVFASAGNRGANDVYPFSPDIETHLEAFQGFTVGVKQRWQTYRGGPTGRHVADFARMNVWGAFFNDTKDPGQLADGRMFFDRPEYSISRNAINGEMVVNLSDATSLLADVNYDVNDEEVGLANIGLAVQRDPRLRYFIGTRYIDDMNSTVGTLGVNYRINAKYQISAFQQYDFLFDNGDNLGTRVALIRKLPRWYVGVTFVADRAADDIGFVISLWPQGVPEFRIGGSRLGTWAASDLN